MDVLQLHKMGNSRRDGRSYEPSSIEEQENAARQVDEKAEDGVLVG